MTTTTTNYKGEVCSTNHSFALDNFIRRLFQKPENIIGPYIKKGDTVMDIGCGPGFFTIDMAKMVGPKGSVIAIDLQNEMLEKVRSKARRQHFEERIRFHNCPQDGLGLEAQVKANFILAFYMVHETPDQLIFLNDVKSHLKKDGRCLIVEPPFHVSQKRFEATARYAIEAGFKIVERPAGKGGKSLLLSL